MRLHSDLTQPALVRSREIEWVPSPALGVRRRPLERNGSEVARATSIVEYAPGARFPQHAHPLGEEFLVLRGVFSDAEGDYPTGSYVRNPPGSAHAPFSIKGCTIFVKLMQMRPGERIRVMHEIGPQPLQSGIARILHDDGSERVGVRWLAQSERMDIASRTGCEVLILSGAVAWDDTQLQAEDWLRVPGHVSLRATEPTQLWFKHGHLS